MDEARISRENFTLLRILDVLLNSLGPIFSEKLEQLESLEKKTVTVYDPANNRKLGEGTLIGSKVYLRR